MARGVFAWTLGSALILAAASPAGAGESGETAAAAVVLPRELLFQPLIADPRWPHFSAAWLFYGGDEVAPKGGGLTNVGAASLGDTFTFYRDSLAQGGAWSFGLQASVHSIFDLDADSRDLVNADYFVGIPVMWQDGSWAAMGRVVHQSSHLGDEFLLRTAVDRVNLSYEGVDVKLSKGLADGALRVYGGTGLLISREPSDLDPWMAQAGIEYRSPWTLLDGKLRPVAGLDLQTSQESAWDVDRSLRIGVQLEGGERSRGRGRGRGATLQFMLEYFDGHNPNGQFYAQPVDWWGLGVHAYY